MITKMVDAKTLEIKPEDVAELEAMRRFIGGTLSLDNPKPFTDNIPVFRVVAVPAQETAQCSKCGWGPHTEALSPKKDPDDLHCPVCEDEPLDRRRPSSPPVNTFMRSGLYPNGQGAQELRNHRRGRIRGAAAPKGDLRHWQPTDRRIGSS